MLIYLQKNNLLANFILRYNAFITYVTLYEYLRGVLLVKKNVHEYKQLLEKSFKILWPNNESILTASRIWTYLRNEGKVIDERDLEIGALCISNKIPLWTKNLKHFIRLKQYGLRLVNIIVEF
ncbi:MAG: type II toxin-antitoxin system VapC family toxin [Candidatus Asgardarchaeia archaeon]